MQKKIGLFGGTFNPIHIGHLRVAWEVKEFYGLDAIYMIPAAIPPHKDLKNIEDAQDRLEMIRLCIEDCPDFIVSDVELQREGRSYTVDTVRNFLSTTSGNVKLYLIIGSDAFMEMATWKSYGELFELIPFIVMDRPGALPDIPHKRQQIGKFLTETISDAYQFSDEQSAWLHETLQPVYYKEVTRLDISATMIRKLLRQGKSIQYLVTEPVRQFIIQKELYR